jgi:signal transduction histidine kinase
VRDDGVGFASEQRTSSGRFRAAHGLGIVSMRERVAEHGGALRIDSEPGRGTFVEITLPLGHEGTS